MFLHRSGFIKPLIFLPRFNYNTLQIRKGLLQSYYHIKGLPTFKPAPNIRKIMTTQLRPILILQQQLDSVRSKLVKAGANLKEDKFTNPEDENKRVVLEEYFSHYQKFVQQVEKSPLNNEWTYQIIGWYNIISLYKTLLSKFIEAQRDQLLVLVKVLSQMKYYWQNPYGIMDQDMFKEQNVTNFYKRISNYTLDLPTLRGIENIMTVPITFTKRRFFGNYYKNHIDQLIRYLQVEDSYTVSDLIWLMNTYVRTMNDFETPIISLQKHIISNRPKLNDEDMSRILQAYQLKGNISKNIYNLIIKPYIIRHRMDTLENLIDMVKFTICSESQDTDLLKQLFELISIKYQQNKISSSKHIYTLHLYTHYLSVKGYRLNLPPNLKKDLTVYCKQRSQGRKNIHHLISKDKQSKTKKYFSACLQSNIKTLQQFQPTKTSVFQALFGYRIKQLKLTDYNIYQKPIACCFQLDYCLSHKTKTQLIDIQIEGIQYVFVSGRLTRQKQIRDEILEHYGIKINHMNYNFLKGWKGLDEDQMMMGKQLGKKR